MPPKNGKTKKTDVDFLSDVKGVRLLKQIQLKNNRSMNIEAISILKDN